MQERQDLSLRTISKFRSILKEMVFSTLFPHPILFHLKILSILALYSCIIP